MTAADVDWVTMIMTDLHPPNVPRNYSSTPLTDLENIDMDTIVNASRGFVCNIIVIIASAPRLFRWIVKCNDWFEK